MLKKSLKEFFSSLLGKKSPVEPTPTVEPASTTVETLTNINNSFNEMNEAVADIHVSLVEYFNGRKQKLKDISSRLSEINDFTRTPEFGIMVVNDPKAVQKLRDEIDDLILQANTI